MSSHFGIDRTDNYIALKIAFTFIVGYHPGRLLIISLSANHNLLSRSLNFCKSYGLAIAFTKP